MPGVFIIKQMSLRGRFHFNKIMIEAAACPDWTLLRSGQAGNLPLCLSFFFAESPIPLFAVGGLCGKKPR